MTGHTTFTAIATASEIALPTSGAPEWIELMRVGANVLGDGRDPFTLANAEAVAQRSLADAPGNMLPIDRDHGTDLTGDSTAYGWMRELEVRDGALWGRVEWTEDGERLVASRGYRFISPTFDHTKKNEVVRLLRAAITNNPAIVTMKAIASQQPENSMNEAMKALAAALGLDASATEEDVVKAATASVQASAAMTTALKPVLAAANVETLDATAATAIAAKLTTTGTAEPDPTKFVAKAAFDEMSTQLASLQKQVNGNAVDTAIDAAKASGKLSPAMEGWGRALAAKDIASFNEWEKTAPVLAAGQLTPPADTATGTAALSAAEKAMCAHTGITEEAFLAQKQKDAA